MRVYEVAYHHCFSQRVLDLATKTKWVDTWAIQKLIKMQNDSTIGLACLTGYVHSLLIVWLAKTTSHTLNIERKYPWKNGKTRQSEQHMIAKDLFNHQVSGTSIASWLLMRFPDSWWYTQLRTLEPKLLSPPLRNGYILLKILNLLYTTEVLPSLIPISLTGQKIRQNFASMDSTLALD